MTEPQTEPGNVLALSRPRAGKGLEIIEELLAAAQKPLTRAIAESLGRPRARSSACCSLVQRGYSRNATRRRRN